MIPVHQQIFETMRKLAGPHPAFRAAHAKGLICTGNFLATADAKKISRASHFQGGRVAATIRFSNSSGNPEVADGAPGVRAMSVKFQLPDGSQADVLANSIDGFVGRTPEEFLAFLRAQLPNPTTGKPRPDALPAFLASHPAAAAFVARIEQKPVPASYATAGYHAEHAFRFLAADGSTRFGRYHWVPAAGESWLSAEEGSRRPRDFLREELAERLARGPVALRLTLQLAEPDDPTDDPTALWPATRPVVELGRLEITAISPTSADDERKLVFDPANVPDGIELSADPVLAARSPAYSMSFEERSATK